MMRRLLASFSMSCMVVCCFASCGSGVKAQTQPVVINEILYNAPDELERLEYIELHNVSSDEVDLTGWELDDEVKFKFPDKTVIAPGQFLVVAKDQGLLDEFFDQRAVGEYKKSLSNSGGIVVLRDAAGNVVESIEYDDRAPWPTAADGYSASLERISATSPGNSATNWAPSKTSTDDRAIPSGTPGQKNSVSARRSPPQLVSVEWSANVIDAGAVLRVTAVLEDRSGVASAQLKFWTAGQGEIGEPSQRAMKKEGQQWIAEISCPPESAGRLLRFCVIAESRAGGRGIYPHPNEVRPAYTVWVRGGDENAGLPVAHFVFAESEGFDAAEQYREEQSLPPRRDPFAGGFGGRGGFNPRGGDPRGGDPRGGDPRGGDPRAERNQYRGRPGGAPEFDPEQRPRGGRPPGDAGDNPPGQGRPPQDFQRGGFPQRGFPGGQFPGGGRGPGRGFPGMPQPFPAVPLPAQGTAALVITDPTTKQTEVFDFVHITRRKSGWKIRLLKDQQWRGMQTLNILYEPDERTVLNESVAYALYELAGSPTYQNGFARVVVNGRPAGYHFYFEQPSSNFFRRNDMDADGDLYKVIWMGNAEMSPRVPESERGLRPDITGRHEKKSNRHVGHQDLIDVIEKLEQAETDEAVWEVIQSHFDVDQVVNYFAVNSLLSHWDGFFNNYFVYFDRDGSGKWSLYPWDQDSTWSMRGGPANELYEMPIYFGAEGATPDGLVETEPGQGSGAGRSGSGGRPGFGPPGFGGPGGGGRRVMWWRPGGEFSRPMLANPQFYALYRQRLADLTEKVFTEEVMGARVDSLKSLEPEIRLRAQIRKADEEAAVEEFNQTLMALHEHLANRRSYVQDALRAESSQ